jgi:hypothetical protein
MNQARAQHKTPANQANQTKPDQTNPNRCGAVRGTTTYLALGPREERRGGGGGLGPGRLVGMQQGPQPFLQAGTRSYGTANT